MPVAVWITQLLLWSTSGCRSPMGGVDPVRHRDTAGAVAAEPEAMMSSVAMQAISRT